MFHINQRGGGPLGLLIFGLLILLIVAIAGSYSETPEEPAKEPDKVQKHGHLLFEHPNALAFSLGGGNPDSTAHPERTCGGVWTDYGRVWKSKPCPPEKPTAKRHIKKT